MKNLKIAVDGPSGAGKSSLARALAHEMGLIYVDTGALYRTIGLFMTENNIDTHDADAVAARLGDIHLELAYQNGTQTVLLNGVDVGDRIRTPQISMAASAVSASIRSITASALTKSNFPFTKARLVNSPRAARRAP